MHLRLHKFWYFKETHEEAHWGETFQVQPMQQGLCKQENSRKACQSARGLNLTAWEITKCNQCDTTFKQIHHISDKYLWLSMLFNGDRRIVH